MNNETDIGLKFTNSVTGQSKLEQYAKTLETIQASLSAIDTGKTTAIQQAAQSTKELTSTTTKQNTDSLGNSFKAAFNTVSIIAFAKVLKNVTTQLFSFTKLSSSYIENLNLFDVAFNNTDTQAEKFVNTMSEMYGMDESNLVRTVGIFKQLANAMGVSQETGTSLSEILTQMSADISSLYNVDFNKAASVLQSALAGQTKPIRGLTGADITQPTLQITMSSYGIDKTVSQLSYAEKRLIIVTSLINQLKASQGDYGRTVESVANQMKVFNEQITRLGRAIGNVLLPILSKILPYLNGILMALVEIFNWIAGLLGFNLKDYDYFSGTDDSVNELSDDLGTANDQAQKLKTGLRGFDKLNVITTPSSGTTTTGGIGTGIDPSILAAYNSALSDYQSKLKDVKMKATDIRDNVMSWLGFTKEIDNETGKVSFKFDHITGGTVLGALAVGGIIYNGINIILGILNKVGLIKFAGLTGLIKGIGSWIKNSVGAISAYSKGITGLGTTLEAIFPKFAKPIELLSTGFTKLAGALGITTGALGLIVAAIAAVVAAFVYAYNTSDEFKEKVNEAVSNIVSVFQGLFDFISGAIDMLIQTYQPVIQSAIDTISAIIQVGYEFLVLTFSNIIDTFNGLFNVINDIIHLNFKQAWQDLIDMVSNLFNNWSIFFDNIKNIFKDLWDKLKINFDTFVTNFGDNVGKIVDFFKELPGQLLYWLGFAIASLIKLIFTTDWFKVGLDVLTFVFNGLNNFNNMLWNWANSLWNGIWNAIANINWASLGTSIFNGIIKGMTSFGTTLSNWGNDFVKGIKNALGIHSPARLVINAKIGNFTTDAIIKGMTAELPSMQETAKGMVSMLNDEFSNVKPIEDNIKSSLDVNTIIGDTQSNLQNGINNSSNIANPSFNGTFIIQVGDEVIANKVLSNLQDMAKSNGKPIRIEA